jgi:hypothetical protein
MKSYQSLAVILCCSTLLIGCAKEPSDEEVYKVISNSIKEDASNLIDKKFFGINLGSVLGIDQLKINAIEKIACDSPVNKKVTCQVLVDFEFVNKKDGLSELLWGVPRTKKIVEYQFIKASQGWQVLEPAGQN